MSHKKFGPDRFSRFDVYWIQTNKQTDKQTNRQAKFIYRYIYIHINMITAVGIRIYEIRMKKCQNQTFIRSIEKKNAKKKYKMHQTN